MRWRIIVGCLMLTVGTAVFTYGFARFQTTLTDWERSDRAVYEFFWGKSAPIPINKDIEKPALRLRQAVGYPGERFGWADDAINACFVGFSIFIVGCFLVRAEVRSLLISRMTTSPEVSPQDIRRRSFDIVMFHAVMFIVLIHIEATFCDAFADAMKDGSHFSIFLLATFRMMKLLRKYGLLFLPSFLVAEYFFQKWLLTTRRHTISRALEIGVALLVVGIIYFCFFGFHQQFAFVKRITVVN
jgi:hypothetical protein